MRIRRTLAAVALGSSLAFGALSAVPAQAAQESAQSLPSGCSVVKNLTNARGQCTAPGSYHWQVSITCDVSWATSDVMTGRGQVNVYCPFGRVLFASILEA